MKRKKNGCYTVTCWNKYIYDIYVCVYMHILTQIYIHTHVHFPDFRICSITCLCFQKDFLTIKMSILSYSLLFLKIGILVFVWSNERTCTQFQIEDWCCHIADSFLMKSLPFYLPSKVKQNPQWKEKRIKTQTNKQKIMLLDAKLYSGFPVLKIYLVSGQASICHVYAFMPHVVCISSVEQ